MPRQPPPFNTPLLSKDGLIQVEVWKRFFLDTRTVVSLAVADTGRLLSTDQLALVDATAGGVTVLLPATPGSGDEVTVKKTDASGNAVTISGNGHTIDGAATRVLAARWNAVTVEGDGSNWMIIATV